MGNINKEIADLLGQIQQRRAKASQLDADAQRLALTDSEKSVDLDALAQATRRLIPRLESEYKKLVARKTAEDLDASNTDLADAMEADLLVKTSGYPSLVEALNAIVPPLNKLNAHSDFRRLAYDHPFLSNATWAPFMRSLPLVFEQWQKEDRAAAERDLWTKKDAEKRRIEQDAARLLADLVAEEEEQPVAAGVTS
ncbi:MAG: hypothetical protein ABSF77_19765 [Spirochaetia bacterium]|jgi:hypothetical protein